MAATHPAGGMAGRSPRPAALPVAGRCRGVLPGGRRRKQGQRIAVAFAGLEHKPSQRTRPKAEPELLSHAIARKQNMGSQTPGAMPEAMKRHHNTPIAEWTTDMKDRTTQPAQSRVGTIATLRPTPVNRRGRNAGRKAGGTGCLPCPQPDDMDGCTHDSLHTRCGPDQWESQRSYPVRMCGKSLAKPSI